MLVISYFELAQRALNIIGELREPLAGVRTLAIDETMRQSLEFIDWICVMAIETGGGMRQV